MSMKTPLKGQQASRLIRTAVGRTFPAGIIAAIATAFSLALGGCETPMPAKQGSAMTVVTTQPQGATVETSVTNAGIGWNLVGLSPISVKWTRNPADPSAGEKQCMVRVSKPGYYNCEKIIPFESMPAELTLSLEKVK